MYKVKLESKLKRESKEMDSYSDSAAGVPAFLQKLWRLVDDPDSNHLIRWSKNGRSFFIQNQAKFARDLLPLNYKHSNMASFIRQLNMYGFRKIPSVESGGLKGGRDEQEFKHLCFKRNHPELLQHIKRKVTAVKKEPEKTVKQEFDTEVYQDVKAIRENQDSMESKVLAMEQENYALLQRIAKLEQKQEQKDAEQQRIMNNMVKQEQAMNNAISNVMSRQDHIVNEFKWLIRYLLTILPTSGKATGVNRRMPLMIKNEPEKQRKKSETVSEGDQIVNEVNEDVDEVMEEESDSEINSSPVHVERPQSTISLISQNFEHSNQSTEVSSNPDESEIVYYVTDPDNNPQELEELNETASLSCNEENVLTTPMVREEMKRTKLLKQRNKRRRKQSFSMFTDGDSTSSNPTKIPCTKVEPEIPVSSTQNEIIQDIKSEEPDPMEFISVDDENPVADTETVVSPNHSEDSHQFVGTSDTIEIIEEEPASPVNENSNIEEEPKLYKPNNFVVGDMPDDIFEESSSEDSYLNENEEKEGQNNQKLQEATDELNEKKIDAPEEDVPKKSSTLAVESNDSSLDKAKKLSSSIADSNGVSSTSTNGASTSAAAASASKSPIGSKSSTPTVSAASTSSSSSAASTSSAPLSLKASSSGTGSKRLSKDKNDTMAIANYIKNSAANSGNIREEFYQNMAAAQEELDTMKDLLQTGPYTLDATTLIGLYESDVFGSLISLSICNDKRDTPMVTFPYSDGHSDIIDRINGNEFDSNTDTTNPASPSSVLNTAYQD